MAALTEIRVAGYKSLRDVQLELRPLNVLIGANGAGKSNLIGLFGLLSRMMRGQFQNAVARSGGANALLHFGSKRTQRIDVQWKAGKNAYRLAWAPAPGDKLFFEEETCFFEGDYKDHEEALGSGHYETLLTQQQRSVPQWVLNHMRSWRVYHFHDTSASAAVKQKGAIGDNDALKPDASNLAAFLFRLRNTDEHSYRRIVATVQQVAPFFEDFALRPDPLSEGQIQLEWSERGSDAYFNAHALSDGTLRFICLATLLLQPQLPSAILIDEPELGLHPAAVTVLGAALRSAASPNNQIIVSTQSVTLVNQFEPEDIVVVDRTGSESTLRRVESASLSEWLDGYSLGELWEKNLLGGRPA